MPENLEIKVRISDRNRMITLARSLGAQFVGEVDQIDTYFRVPRGRLKLRQTSGGPAELIHYEREETSNQRLSHFETYPTSDPQQLRELLERALGVQAVVSKRRSLFLYRDTRIHIDEVDGLGCFLEFEVQIETSLDEAERRLIELVHYFELDDHDFIRSSYVDLIPMRSAQC